MLMLLENYFVEMVLNALKMKGYNKTLLSLPVLKTSPQYFVSKSMPTSRESHTICTTCVYISQFVYHSPSTLLLRHYYYNLSGISSVKRKVSFLPLPPSHTGHSICSSEPSQESNSFSSINSRHPNIITREQMHQQSSSPEDKKTGV